MDPLRIRNTEQHGNDLGRIARSCKRCDEVDRAIKLAGEDPELLDTKGFVLMKSGDLNGAEKIFRQAFNATQNLDFSSMKSCR